MTRLVFALILLFPVSCGPLFAPPSASEKELFVIPDDGSLPTIPELRIEHRLLVRDTQANSFINSRKIIFSRSEATRGYYQFAQWVEPPPRRLTLLLLERLERTEVFSSVSALGTSTLGELQLNTEITEFYHDVSEAPGEVHLRLRVELVDLIDRSIIADNVFKRSVPAATYNVEGAVEGFTRAVNSILNDVVLWTVQSAPRNNPPDENTR